MSGTVTPFAQFPRAVRPIPDPLALYRTAQISELSRIPEQIRPQRFLAHHVRPATDQALAIAQWGSAEMARKATSHRKRLDLTRIALGKRAVSSPPTSLAQLPTTRVAREGRR